MSASVIAGGGTTALDRRAPKRVSWIELFFDLVFVAAVGQVGRPLAEHTGPDALVRYVVLLVLIWWAWHGYATYATRVDPDTRVARALTLLQMTAVVFMAANAEDQLGSDSTAGFVAAYGVMRGLLAVQYACTPGAVVVPLRHVVIRGLAVGSALWVASALVPVPWRYAAWVAAAGVELVLERAVLRRARRVPPHAHHLPERFGLFTLILLGEAIVSIMRGVQQQPVWSLPAVLAVTAGLGTVCLVWWAYFDITGATAPRPVASRDDVRALAWWTYAHLPLYLGVALLGVEVEHLIRDGGHLPDDGWRLGQAAAALVAMAGSLALLWRQSPRQGARHQSGEAA
jgi:low temperature requirement protein LtrA